MNFFAGIKSDACTLRVGSTSMYSDFEYGIKVDINHAGTGTQTTCTHKVKVSEQNRKSSLSEIGLGPQNIYLDTVETDSGIQTLKAGFNFESLGLDFETNEVFSFNIRVGDEMRFSFGDTTGEQTFNIFQTGSEREIEVFYEIAIGDRIYEDSMIMKVPAREGDFAVTETGLFKTIKDKAPEELGASEK